MIRTILYRLGGDGAYTEGVLHGFSEGHAIIENIETGEIGLVPVKAGNLKFKVKTTEWVEMQVRAQREAQAQQVVAMPNVNFRTGR